MKTVVRMKFGSHLYGTDTPASDMDYKGIFIPDGRDILLQQIKHTISTQRRKAQGEKNFAGEVDEEAYALHRFLQLAGEGQTVALDVLFASDDVILDRSPIWDALVENRGRLLTRKSAAFVGYCRTQANKYGIRGSRVNAAKAAVDMFAAILEGHGTQQKVGQWDWRLKEFVAAHPHSALVPMDSLGREPLMHFECCNRKVPYTVSVKDAHAIFSRIYEEYGHRARKAALNEGVDWKALSHAVRVARQAIELLDTHKIMFPLAYASHLIDIKLGRLAYEPVAEEIEGLLEAVEQASERSTLPDAPDFAFIDDFVAEHYRTAVETL
jgi:predicted nucleotidyltransferase